MYSLSEIAKIVHGQIHGNDSLKINHLYTDTRKIQEKNNTLFFAITTPKDDGHRYIKQALKMGVTAVVVSKKPNIDCTYILVNDSLLALQELTKKWREKFNLPVFGITGSNGKTIVKEWLSFLLQHSYSLCKNPKSYNSQIGVPHSVWQLNTNHTLGIFEAGISAPGEMEKLNRIIQPNIGIFTYLGDAHGHHFQSQQEKLIEKIKLFENCSHVICPDGQPKVIKALEKAKVIPFTWGNNPKSIVQIKQLPNREYSVRFKDSIQQITLPFSDKASIQNAFTALTAALFIGEDLDAVCEKLANLPIVDMRLQQTAGIYNTQLILDYYNADYQSVVMAIDFLNQQKVEGQKCVVILSDIMESDLSDKKLYKKLNTLLTNNHIQEFIAIGPNISKHQDCFSLSSAFYPDTITFLKKHPTHQFKDKMVVLKGAREYKFEHIAERLKLKTHQTALYVNLTRLQKNINTIKNTIGPNTQLMAMVKAFAYGNGGHQLAKLLEYNKIDYLGVAYTDEATQLKNADISTPIMVLNPDLTDLTPYTDFTIQPVVYNASSLDKIKDTPINVHIELDTGMHRLGFSENELEHLIATLKEHPNIHVVSIFSHLAAADDPELDSFSLQQIDSFKKSAQKIELALGIQTIKHIANTAGIERFNSAKMDMVRLGIGLYGVSSAAQTNLLPVSSFKSYITQIRTVPAGDGIGYGNLNAVDYDRKIAIIAVGYADGYSRLNSQGVGVMLINGQRATVVGNVCMDMTFCDVTHIPCQEKDEVIIFGDNPSVEEVSSRIKTIPYEILTSVSNRVNRVFFQE